MSERREAFREHLPDLIESLDHGNGVHLHSIYASIEDLMSHLIDDERDNPPSTGLKWKHDLRWELETLVIDGKVRRRKDLGRGMYSV